jgi:hypothetical protein
MANDIDPTSIDLGKSDPNKYTADYIPSAAPLPDSKCALPPALKLDLTPAKLIPLNETCIYTFPDVIPIPPVYNPPQIKFLACETLSAETNIQTCSAASKSTLVLTSKGPDPADDGGPASCGLSLEGLLCVEACEDFDASVNITFGSALQGSKKDASHTDPTKQKPTTASAIALTLRDRPHCGFDIVGNIAVTACESFHATQDISFLHAAAGSNLTLNFTNTPECSLTLGGIIDVKACETYESAINIALSGSAVKGQSLTSTSTSIPNCGIVTNFEAVIDACTEVFAGGAVSFSGAAEGAIYLETGAAGCGVLLSGNVHVPKGCDTISFSGGQVSGGNVSFYNADGSHAGTAEIGGAVDVQSSKDGCSHVINVTLSNTSITLPKLLTDSLLAGGGGGGGGGGAAPGVVKNYGCSERSAYRKKYGILAEDQITTMQLASLGVNTINSSECCQGSCTGTIDMCHAWMSMDTIQVNNITTNPTCGSKVDPGSSLSLSDGYLYLFDLAGSSTKLDPNYVYIGSSSGAGTHITGESMVIGDSCGRGSSLNVDQISSVGCCDSNVKIDLCSAIISMDDGGANILRLDPTVLHITSGGAGGNVNLNSDTLNITDQNGVSTLSTTMLYIGDREANSVTILPGSIQIVGNGTVDITPPGANCSFSKLTMCVSEDSTSEIFVMMCG